MCGSVEMLSKSCAEKFISDSVTRECIGKMLPCAPAEIFHWCNLPIGIGGTLHPSASPLGFISLYILCTRKFSDFPRCTFRPVRHLGNKNEAKKNDPLR
jgi:hypothetical protein